MALLALSAKDSRAFAANAAAECAVERVAEHPGIDQLRRMLHEGRSIVIETAGSTGIPKRVVVGAAALRASAEATAARIGEGRWVLALPSDYIAGLQVLTRSLLAGTSPVPIEGRFTPAAFLAATRTASGDAPLFTALVPAQLATLVEAAESEAAVHAAVSEYRAILVGGQAAPMPLRERAAALGMPIVRTFGSTETSGGCVYDGVALGGVEVSSVGGELRIAGATLADGYLGDPKGTARTFVTDEEGRRWYRTGDLGAVTEGLVSVSGRVDRVIISGGVNVSLDQVERVVREVPGLAEAVVVGIADERWGQAAVIVVAGDERADAEALLAASRARVVAELGIPARPRELRLIETMPTLSSGKPDRGALAS